MSPREELIENVYNNLEILKRKTKVGEIIKIIAREIGEGLGKSFKEPKGDRQNFPFLLKG